MLCLSETLGLLLGVAKFWTLKLSPGLKSEFPRVANWPFSGSYFLYEPSDECSIPYNIFPLGYRAPEVSEWIKYHEELKRNRKRKLQGTYTDLTAAAPAFGEGLDEVVES